MYVNDEGMNMKVFDDINIVNMYNDDEVFVMHINNTNEILSSIGNVIIDVEYSNEDVIIVDEEMFNNDISKYSIDDARAVEYIIVDEPIGQNEIDVGDLSKKLLSGLMVEQNLYGIMSDNNIDTDYKVIDMSSYSDKFSEIQDMFNIYVTYKKDVENQNKITLYFNYNNYINTPFIKIEDSKVYSNIIEGTYLKLEAGENDSLDIVIQLRYVEHGNIIGYKNIKVLSYQIYNISDDKPKFVISEIYRYNNNTSLTK
jgi:galactitol-specific phosphotransferase system IIB component